jgi:hypothetical protein
MSIHVGVDVRDVGEILVWLRSPPEREFRREILRGDGGFPPLPIKSWR